MKSIYFLLLTAVIGGRCATAQEFIIRGATVHTASAKGTLKNTDVVVRGGMIVAIGSDVGVSGTGAGHLGTLRAQALRARALRARALRAP